jgi:hypothetical protein
MIEKSRKSEDSFHFSSMLVADIACTISCVLHHLQLRRVSLFDGQCNVEHDGVVSEAGDASSTEIGI